MMKIAIDMSSSECVLKNIFGSVFTIRLIK